MHEENSTTTPRRAILLKVEIGADDWPAAARALDSIGADVARGEWREGGVSGGPDSGYMIQTDVDESWTHDRYFSEIEKEQRHAGSSLVELLIVVTILGLLVSMAVPRMMGALGRAHLATTTSDLRTLADAIDEFNAEVGRAPFNLAELQDPLGAAAARRFDYRPASAPEPRGFARRGDPAPDDRWAPPGVEVYGWEARSRGDGLCPSCLREDGGDGGVPFVFVTGGGGPIRQGGPAGPNLDLDGGGGGPSLPVVLDPCDLFPAPEWCLR